MIEGGKVEFCTVTKSISGSGVSIVLLKKIAPGEILDMEIFSGDSKVGLRCRGQVVWVSDSEAGIQFIGSDLMYLGKLINDLSEREVKISF